MEYFGKSPPGGKLSQGLFNPSNRTTLIPGVDYEIKSFGNREETKNRMRADIITQHPHLSSKDVDLIVDTATQSHFDIITNDKKNKRHLASMDAPLPEGTTWKDIKIFIDRFDEKHPVRSVVHILVRGKTYRTTNFHEMHLENTKEGKISDGGKILYFISLGSCFMRNGDKDLDSAHRKMKERLSHDLQVFFGIKIDPFILEGKIYKPLFEISTRERDLLQKKYPKFLKKSAVDLLKDFPIFS